MTKTTLIFLTIIASNNIFAQTAQKNLYSFKPRFNGISFGVNATDFYRNSNDKFQTPLKNPNLGLNVGFIVDIVNQRRWGSQIEIKYSRKGATETFNNKQEQEFVTTKSKLDYLQLEIIPLVLKPIGFKKFNPYISVGGYYSSLLKSNFEYQFSEKFDIDTSQPNNLKIDNLNESDIGFCLNAGISFNFFSVEYRQEFGTKNIITDKAVKNQLNSITLKFTR